MSSDSTRGGAPIAPGDKPSPPEWAFDAIDMRWLDLTERVRVPRGVETVEVYKAVEVRLKGRLDPGDMVWFDSYMPTLRIGDAESSRVESAEDGVTFTFYPEIDGNVRGGSVEFRARVGEPFEPTGLEIEDQGSAE